MAKILPFRRRMEDYIRALKRGPLIDPNWKATGEEDYKPCDKPPPWRQPEEKAPSR